MRPAFDNSAADAGLRIHLLGGFSVTIDGREIPDAEWRLRKAKNLVKLLALSPTHCLHRERIMDLFWPDLDPSAAANNLRQVLHVARGILKSPASQPPEFLRIHDESIRLTTGDVWTDVRAFEAAVSDARGSADPAVVRSAAALYAGDLLPDDPYEDWTIARREELRSTYLELLGELARLYEERGERTLAIETLKKIVTLDPVQEEAYVRLMRLHALDGNRHLVKYQYRRLKDALKRELEAQPEDASEQLYRDILAGRYPGRKGAMPEGLANRGHNLPVPLTSFVGRAEEIAEVKELLATARLVTLVGAGGSGKTRLAIEVARGEVAGQGARGEGASHAGGAWLVDLSPLTDAESVYQTIRAALGAREVPGMSPIEALVRQLTGSDLLLVLDNCEHLVEACAELATELLRSCPGLRIIATSRQALDVAGEVAYRVPSLSVPVYRGSEPAEALEKYEAVRLFAERTRLVWPEFKVTAENAAAVVEICRRLDGMPLALELAAARVKVLSVQQIAARLGDRFRLLAGDSQVALHRHQTLREVMNWSYNLLSPLEQALFARLSVFAGGWTLDAAQAICCDGAPAPEAFDPAAEAARPEQPAHDTPFPGSGGSVLDLLGRLVDRSLVVVERDRHGASRYRMLETVREYASERLAEEGAREDLEVRHAEFYGTLALQVEPGLVGSDQAKHADRLEAELDNLRVAMGRSLERGRVDLALRVATALPQFFWMRGYYHEGREWLERCLEMEAERVREGFPRDSLQRARALDGAGLMAQCQADWDAAERYCEESLALWREINHMAGAGSALTNLGMLAMWRGRFSEAGPLLEESLSLELESGEPGGVVYALLYLALLALLTGDHLKAARFGAEAETRTRELGNQRARGAALGIRAWEYLERRDTAAAEQLCRACVGMLAEVGERWILALGIEVSAGVAAMKGQHRRAMKLAGGAAALRQAGRGALSPTLETTFERWLAPSREALDPRAAELAWAQGNELTFEELVAAALATEGDGPAGADNPAVVGLAPLTRRENRVAALVASGLTNRRIARELEIGEGTVANHVERILRKLGLTSRSQIAAWVIEHQAPSPGYRAYSPGRHSPGAFPELF